MEEIIRFIDDNFVVSILLIILGVIFGVINSKIVRESSVYKRFVKKPSTNHMDNMSNDIKDIHKRVRTLNDKINTIEGKVDRLNNNMNKIKSDK